MNSLNDNEESKRARHLTPEERWRQIQAAITWAEAQLTVRRNTPARCLQEQARKRRSTSA